MAHGQKPDLFFRAKRTSPFKSAGGVTSVDCWQQRCAASAVVMLDTPCSEVVWRVLATHCIRQFPLQIPSRASPCAITFQLESNNANSCTVCTLSHMCINTNFSQCGDRFGAKGIKKNSDSRECCVRPRIAGSSAQHQTEQAAAVVNSLLSSFIH